MGCSVLGCFWGQLFCLKTECSFSLPDKSNQTNDETMGKIGIIFFFLKQDLNFSKDTNSKHECKENRENVYNILESNRL